MQTLASYGLCVSWEGILATYLCGGLGRELQVVQGQNMMTVA